MPDVVEGVVVELEKVTLDAEMRQRLKHLRQCIIISCIFSY